MFITLVGASIVNPTKIECSIFDEMWAWVGRTYWGHSKTTIATMETIHKNYPYNQLLQRTLKTPLSSVVRRHADDSAGS